MAAPRSRDHQRPASETAILDAAWSRFARLGPDGTSLRDIGTDAGCTHALVARYFGSKGGLVVAVADELTERVGAAVDEVWAHDPDPMAGLVFAARRHRSGARLLVRCALGDLRPERFPGCLRAEQMLTRTLAHTPSSGGPPDRRSRLLAYAASSVVLGWLSFEGFLVAATRLEPVTARRRDAAIAAVADRLMGLAGEVEPRLAARDLSGLSSGPFAADDAPSDARSTLLESAIELFARRGPASVSVRDISRHCGVNQGLIYRHFGSKDALLADAIEQGSSGLFPAALAAEGFDFDSMIQLMHHRSPAARLIVRTLVDDIDIAAVRKQFPVLRRLLDDYDDVPIGPDPADVSDPRVVVAAAAGMALGSVIWGDHLRAVFGLSSDDGVEAAIADVARVMISWPTTTRATPLANP